MSPCSYPTTSSLRGAPARVAAVNTLGFQQVVVLCSCETNLSTCNVSGVKRSRAQVWGCQRGTQDWNCSSMTLEQQIAVVLGLFS